MPTPAWREEKAEYVVQSICRVLASPDTPQTIQDELGGVALWNALKLSQRHWKNASTARKQSGLQHSSIFQKQARSM